MILLYSDQVHGQVHFAEAIVEGYLAPARIYSLANHFLQVHGGGGVGAEAIAIHDAEELIAHGVYRLATPEEQNASVAEQRKATSVEETPTGSAKNKKNTNPNGG